MATIKDIFDVWYGVNMEVVNSEIRERGIPFVSRQSVNNGVVCYVAPVDGIKPNPANTLSIAVSGSVLSTFYHDYEYYSGRDVYVAKPKEPMTKEEMLYYAYVIEQNKYRYNYGRGANRTFRDIVVPALNEVPIQVRKAHIPTIKDVSMNKQNMKLNTEEWKWFCIKDFCQKPYKATAYNATELEDCSKYHPKAILYVTRTDVNNGCRGYVVNEGFTDVEDENALTIGDTTSTIYYHAQKFICGDHMVVLRCEHFNLYTGLFIATLLNLERFRYNYGRAFNMDIIADTRIKLPVTPSGEPDWQFMEDYIKSLPYSKNIEPSKPNEVVDELVEMKKEMIKMRRAMEAQQSGSLVNYGTVNIYEK